MLFIDYTRTGRAVSDEDALTIARGWISLTRGSYNHSMEISTRNIITALRVLVVSGEINPAGLVFFYGQHVLRLNYEGDFIEKVPLGFVVDTLPKIAT